MISYSASEPSTRYPRKDTVCGPHVTCHPRISVCFLWSFYFFKTNETIVICYQLRYVEDNHREHGSRWSERQVGLYHQVQGTANVLLLLHAKPDSKLRSRIHNSADTIPNDDCSNPSKNPLSVHVMILTTYIDEWRWYLDDIGTKCGDFVSNILLCPVITTPRVMN